MLGNGAGFQPSCSVLFLLYPITSVHSPRCVNPRTSVFHMGTKTPELPYTSDIANLDSAKCESLECVVNNQFVELDLPWKTDSLELVFGEEFLNVTGLSGLYNTGGYKSKAPHERSCWNNIIAPLLQLQKEKKAIIRSFNRLNVFL